MFPLATFDKIEIGSCNDLLTRWAHKMGPLERPYTNGQHCHALAIHGDPVAVTTTSSLVRKHVGGDGLAFLTRDNTVELSRVCAGEQWATRVVLRLWRELVFPGLFMPYAISYQDAALHSGDLYRFDGWSKVGFARGGGTDARSGRKGRDKWVWLWTAAPDAHKTIAKTLRAAA